MCFVPFFHNFLHDFLPMYLKSGVVNWLQCHSMAPPLVSDGLQIIFSDGSKVLAGLVAFNQILFKIQKFTERKS
jgi:hypothetical protein